MPNHMQELNFRSGLIFAMKLRNWHHFGHALKCLTTPSYNDYVNFGAPMNT